MTKSKAKTHVFLKSCGCLACAIVNVPRNFGALARAQRYAKVHGESYHLMDTAVVRTMMWICPEHAKAEGREK